MAKRNFAPCLAAVAASLLLAAAGTAQADLRPVEIDGCAHLARVVYQEVSAAAIYGPGQSGPWLIEANRGDIQECTTVARTVSRAFTSALQSAGIRVRWMNGTIESGDFCASGFLSQCYPDRGGPGGGGLDLDNQIVQRSWSIVSQTVMREMYNPISSDQVRFQDGDLKLRMGLSLRSVRLPIDDDLPRQRGFGVRHDDPDVPHRR